MFSVVSINLAMGKGCPYAMMSWEAIRDAIRESPPSPPLRKGQAGKKANSPTPSAVGSARSDGTWILGGGFFY